MRKRKEVCIIMFRCVAYPTDDERNGKHVCPSNAVIKSGPSTEVACTPILVITITRAGRAAAAEAAGAATAAAWTATRARAPPKGEPAGRRRRTKGDEREWRPGPRNFYESDQWGMPPGTAPAGTVRRRSSPRVARTPPHHVPLSPPLLRPVHYVVRRPRPPGRPYFHPFRA